jgi:hypothetical protein
MSHRIQVKSHHLIAKNYQLSNLDLSKARNKKITITNAEERMHNSLDEANIERFQLSLRDGNSQLSGRIGN